MPSVKGQVYHSGLSLAPALELYSRCFSLPRRHFKLVFSVTAKQTELLYNNFTLPFPAVYPMHSMS